MIAPTGMYDAFPTLTPTEAALMITDAMIDKPKRKATRLGTFGEILYAVSPKTTDQILNTAYNLFPDSKAAKKGSKKASPTASRRPRGEGRRREVRGDVDRGGRDGVPDARGPLVTRRGACSLTR